MKKNYVQPLITTVSVATETVITSSVSKAASNVGMKYGGASTNDNSGQGARVKEDVYDVWDDNWSE